VSIRQVLESPFAVEEGFVGGGILSSISRLSIF
jgi:hypothetical protein